MVEALLATETIVQAMADNSKSVKWLDVPDGDVASGDPSFSVGFIKRSRHPIQQRKAVSEEVGHDD